MALSSSIILTWILIRDCDSLSDYTNFADYTGFMTKKDTDKVIISLIAKRFAV